MKQRIIKLLARARHLFVNDSLFRNATFLMASTAIMSALGFGFWVFVAHLYTPSQIGTASALITVTTLLSNLSMLGLNAGLVRFLPHSKNQSRDINAAIIAVGSVTLLAAILYLIVSNVLGLQIPLLAQSWEKLAFVGLMATVSLNTLTDAVFVANRRAEFHTIGYTIFAIVKLVVPAFVVALGALGVFTAYILAVVTSLVYSLVFMWRVCGYHILSRPNWNLLAKTWKFSVNNYIGVVLAGIPSQLMPLLIIARLGTANVAYFSMAWTMANLLYVIPSATTQSLLAESSHRPDKQLQHIRYSIGLLAKILVPAVGLAIIVAPYMLRVFGGLYSQRGAVIFQLFAFATFFIAINQVCNTVLNIRRRTSGIVFAQAAALVVTGISVSFLIRYGLTGVGFAMLLGNATSSLCYVFIFARLRQHLPTASDASKAYESDERPVSGPNHVVIDRFLKQYNVSTVHIGQDIGGGDRSSTIIVTTGQERYVLKIYSSQKHSIAETREELKFMDSLRSHGVATPRVIPTLRGELVAQVPIRDSSDTWVGTLMTFESGQHPRAEAMSGALLHNMAYTQARMHSWGINYARLPGTIENMQKQRSLGSLLLSWMPKGVSHFDFDQSNLLVKGDRVSCVLDFEGLRFDPIIICLLFTLSTLPHRRGSGREVEVYMRAYQTIRKLTAAEIVTLRIALALHYRRPSLLAIHV